MKKICKLWILILLSFVTTGCCLSVGSIVMGKDCNKKMYCNSGSVSMDYAFDLPTTYSASYEKAVKSVVTVLSSSTGVKAGSSSSGSGIIYKIDDTYAYILTNRHVVAIKSSTYSLFHNHIEIILSNYKKVSGTLVGAATGIDVAVIKVDKSAIEGSYELPIVKNSFTDIDIGDAIFAIGSPLGTDHAFSASFGSISNLYNTKVDFTSSNLGVYYPIQIDAAVNPGNSGGGLFNGNGDLVGMVQGGRTVSSENDSTIITTGINYAIPITTAINVGNNLILNGSYEFADIGIDSAYIEDLKLMSNSDRTALGINDSERSGIYVRHINLLGAASIAGMSSKFVVESIDGINMNSKGVWEMYLASKNEGEVVVVKGHYINSDIEVTYNITLK
ncbi:MAG: serine protease [Erysipelotrichaceae bacterium]|nr:serine protease [Erysipelotrichaceae bacterium]